MQLTPSLRGHNGAMLPGLCPTIPPQTRAPPSLDHCSLPEADVRPSCQAQTPQQRLANERFAKSEASKRGKPQATVKKQEVQKSPISTGWIAVLAFILCGGVLFELLRLFF
ncbi:endoplasmic stress-associated ramp4 [Diplodia corticola]|uniref:Stress-associated endoplasmic reticulum protein n=1 Tax=Diplodia corticola TaxID=236234 RepID=A0A1J9RTE1_9PEZI|nr:endoplasmic stress-associated ramp4 [Diplodia corticola]OJD31140.1 endoplasmic stress-associated ramp4 [Diplodia corticola]